MNIDTLALRIEWLSNLLKQYGKVAIGFSGGTDSSYLLSLAVDALGPENVLAATVISPAMLFSEIERARVIAKKLNVELLELPPVEFDCEDFLRNDNLRCYYCKKARFSALVDESNKRGFMTIIDGTNADDSNDYRPGEKAIHELGVISPLKKYGITKEEIRMLSQERGLISWDAVSEACLATRLATGMRITDIALRNIEAAENLLRDKGMRLVRVRVHDSTARIEVLPDDIPYLISLEYRQEISSKLHELGFKFVTVDLDGYRMGSMNDNTKK
ncbi:MAG: ATP-dependent sacrificial sulfur transferase LarE [bacterium]